MLCNLYLSKVLKVKHTIESTLYEAGLHTTIFFHEANIRGTVVEIKPVGKGNRITIDILNSDWEILSNLVNKFNGVK